MPPRKKKTVFTGGSGRKRPFVPPSEPTPVRANFVAIDVNAGAGREGLNVGDRVRIVGSGLYAGEEAVVERFTGTAIPTAVVRTTSGPTRHVRTIDLEPIRGAD